MPGKKLWINGSLGEEIMKITIVGWVLILAAIIAVLILLDSSAENPSIAKFLSNLRKPDQSNELPETEPFTPPE
jgi:hypothetical protein